MITALPLGVNGAALAPRPDSETPAMIHEPNRRLQAGCRQHTAWRPARRNLAGAQVGVRHISEILPGVLARYLRGRGRDREAEGRRD